MLKPYEITLPAFPGVILPAAEALIVGTAFFDRDKNYIGRWTDSNTYLEWKTRLRPECNYDIVITQANPSAEVSEWKITGLKKELVSQSFQTGSWESFESVLLPVKSMSNNKNAHTIRILPGKVAGAVMNLRELILIENQPNEGR